MSTYDSDRDFGIILSSDQTSVTEDRRSRSREDRRSKPRRSRSREDRRSSERRPFRTKDHDHRDLDSQPSDKKNLRYLKSQSFESLDILQSQTKTTNYTYILNTTYNTFNDKYYVLVQFTESLSIRINGFEYSFSSEKTQIMGLEYPRKQRRKDELLNFEVFSFDYVNQQKLGWSDMTTSKYNLVISLAVFGNITFDNRQEQHTVNSFKIFKFDLMTLFFVNDHTLVGFRKINVNAVGKGFYISGTGTSPMTFNGSPLPTTSIQEDYVVALVNEKDVMVWVRLGLASVGTNLGDSLVTNSSESAYVGENGDLYTTGCFLRKIKLDVTYTGNDTNLQMWWAQIDSCGKWVRSGVITGGNLVTDFIIGESIIVNGGKVIVTGSFRGCYSVGDKELKSTVTSVFVASVESRVRKSRGEKSRKGYGHQGHEKCDPMDVEQIDPHISVDDTIVSLFPRLALVGRSAVLYFYYDTMFKYRNITYMSKGSTDLAIIVLNEKTHSIMNVEGHTVNHGTDVLTGMGEIIIGGSSLISNSRTNSFIITYRI